MRPTPTIEELHALITKHRKMVAEIKRTGNTRPRFRMEPGLNDTATYLIALQIEGARLIRAAQELALIESLRAAEGSSVLLCCPNPDFDGPAQAIEVCGEWTGWIEKQFYGETLGECLLAAEAERLEFEEATGR